MRVDRVKDVMNPSEFILDYFYFKFQNSTFWPEHNIWVKYVKLQKIKSCPPL